MTEKFKPVVTEKYLIEEGDESKTFEQWECSDYQNSEAWIRTHDYPIKHY